MFVGTAINLTADLLSSAFPVALFAGGEIGVWYDPSDITTLFQDNLGATPVTAPAQTVGLILDKSGRGNNATQATSTQRPTYGINPITGTRNLLTYSQDFSQSIWAVAGAATKTASASVCPDGTTSAYTISVGTGSNFFWYNSLNITAAARYEPSVYIKRVTTTGTLRINSSNGTANGQWTINLALLGSGFERITRSHPAVTVVTEFTGTGNNFSGITFVSVAGTLQFEVWGAQIELGTTSTAYQKVVTQYEVTEAGVQSVSYLRFDGVDDGMVTGTITPAIDKVQIFVGLRKLSDAAQKIVAELSATIASNAGSFALTAPNSAAANYNFSSKGTTQTDNVVTTYTSPITSVISGLGDIAGASNLIRVNGTQVGSTLTTQGTGNYLAYPLYLGRRGGTTLPFNGRIYSMIVRFGSNMTAGQIASTESWVNSKTGAY